MRSVITSGEQRTFSQTTSGGQSSPYHRSGQPGTSALPVVPRPSLDNPDVPPPSSPEPAAL
ncbi:MAG: hypothetical protein AAF721_21810 [Myxococcota bacterium]